jgi:serine acetyltransferase
MEKYKNEYKAFIKMISNDYPYEIEIDDDFLSPIFDKIYNDLLIQHSHILNKFYSNGTRGIINFCFLDHYLIFCFRLANYLYQSGYSLLLAEAIYYSSKIRTSTDLFYTANIGEYFIPVHSLGAIIDSRAKYGKLLKVYNGVHIGPYDIVGVPADQWKHPIIGNGVILLANSGVFGDTEIGDNVIVSMKSIIINEKIPNDCIVMGQSPRLSIIPHERNNLELLRYYISGKPQSQYLSK